MKYFVMIPFHLVQSVLKENVNFSLDVFMYSEMMEFLNKIRMVKNILQVSITNSDSIR